MTNHFTRGSGILEGFLSKKRADKANSLINTKLREGRILDVGCGSYPYFLTETNFKEKFGIDPSLEETKIKGISLSKSDITNDPISFSDDYFDVVTMLAVFEHIDNYKLDNVLSQIHRILKKEGRLIITTPAPWADKVLHSMAYLGLISKEEIHEHKHNLKRKSIEEILGEAGFKNIKSGFFELGFNMWFSVEK